VYKYLKRTQLISAEHFESIGGCSYGIAVEYDSDRNLITDNTLIVQAYQRCSDAGFGTVDQIFTCSSNGILLIVRSAFRSLTPS